MRIKEITVVLAVVLSGVSVVPAIAAKPVKSNFTSMTELLNAMKAKGVTCSSYSKTPAELVIEEGKCTYQGAEILIDLWPKAKTAKDFAEGMKKLAAYNIETGFWEQGSKMFIFYSNNYTLSIDGISPNTKKVENIAKGIQKKLGIKFEVGS